MMRKTASSKQFHPQPPAYAALAQRGLLAIARDIFQVKAHPHAHRLTITYPVFDLSGGIIDRRYKYLSGSGSKYSWQMSSQPRPRWYHAPGLQPVDGVLYIANGEPSVWAYHAAGVPNVLSFFGETIIPPTLAADLTRLGVTEVRYPADKDDTGLHAALRVRQALHGSGITYRPLAWPADLPEKGDANDLWIYTGFDPVAFRDILENLPPLMLPQEKRPRPVEISGPVVEGESAYEQAITDLKQRIGELLDVDGYNDKGFSRRTISSPFRRDIHPSASYNVQAGVLYDFGTATTHKLAELCAHFGLEMPRRAPRRRQAAAPLVFDWQIHTLPDSWRCLLNRFAARPGALVAEILSSAIRSGHINPAGFTTRDLEAAALQLGITALPRTLRSGLETLTNIFITRIGDSENIDKSVSIIGNKQGRPFVQYRVCTSVEQLIANLNEVAVRALYAQQYPVTEYGEQGRLARFTADMLVDVGLDNTAEAVHALNKALAHLDEQLTPEAQTAIKRARKSLQKITGSLLNLHSTPLEPGWPLETPRQYTVLLARSLHKARGAKTTMSRRELCEAYGVSNGALDGILREAGIESTPRPFQVVEIAPDEPFMQAVRRHARLLKGRARGVIAQGRDGKTEYCSCDNPHVLDFVERKRQEQAIIRVDYQVANEQTVLDMPPPSLAPPAPPPPPRPQPQQKADAPAAPRRPRYVQQYGPRYRPEFVRGHLLRALRLLGWHGHPDGLIDPRTGEIVSFDVPLSQLYAHILAATGPRGRPPD